MLKQRQGHDEPDTEMSVAAEERIRQDERRKVLAELADTRDADAEDAGDVLPPPPPQLAPTPDAAERPTDPRRWDVPDDRWEQEPIDRTDRVDQVPVLVRDDTVTERGFSPGQILLALAGAAALALGIVAVSRTGLEGPLSQPVEPVLGFDHTALLGLFEIGAGALMLLSSLRAGVRWLGGLIGIAAIVGGVLVLGELDWTVDELGAERDFGWVAIAIGAAALVGAAIPRIRRTRRVSTTTSAVA